MIRDQPSEENRSPSESARKEHRLFTPVHRKPANGLPEEGSTCRFDYVLDMSISFWIIPSLHVSINRFVC